MGTQRKGAGSVHTFLMHAEFLLVHFVQCGCIYALVARNSVLQVQNGQWVRTRGTIRDVHMEVQTWGTRRKWGLMWEVHTSPLWR